MKLLKYFLFFTFFLFIPKTYALETTTIYRNASLSNTGFLYTTSSSLTGTIYNGSVNTVIADASYGITFFINKGTVPGKVYKIRVNFNDYDYLKSNNHNKVTITNGEECAVVGFQLINQGGSHNQAKGVDITYTCLSAGSYTGVQLAYYNEDNSAYDRITTISWRINNAQWEQVDDNQSAEIIANATINTNNIINNNNENTQDIIAGQSSQTDRIIQNQNEIAEQQKEQQKVCNVIDKNNVVINDKYLTSNGNLTNISGWGITDYIDIYKAEITFVPFEFITSSSTCFYDLNKTLLNCYVNNTLSSITIPTNAYYMRISLLNSSNKPRATVCKNGNQALNDSLTDDNIGDSASDMGDFLNSFNTNTFGLTSIITAPLNLIQSITSSTCTDLQIPLPYLNNKKLTLPCMTPIYQSTFGSLFTLYQTITFGIIAYWICVRIFNMVKDFKNPDHDEIEVVDL